MLGVYLLESRFLPLDGLRRALALLGIAATLLAWIYPGEIRPALASRWIPLHWVLGIASYGLFGAAVLHATLLNRADRRMRVNRQPAPMLGLPLLRLERLTYRFVEAGFVTLTAAVLLGWWFASPWRWDHKSVFSLLGWSVFAGLVVGRRVSGWRGPAATRWLYVGAGLLLLAYVGSRFVLEVLLHRPPAP
ncbi:cytochrome c biogenesis protein CcsA [Piscinibacter sakaiensis]|uniref:cytochrome C assembly family protein n=1 Tax=Piscinibacter sakaiensis TaxID=1547922 RepID=UPI003727E2A2